RGLIKVTAATAASARGQNKLFNQIGAIISIINRQPIKLCHSSPIRSQYANADSGGTEDTANYCGGEDQRPRRTGLGLAAATVAAVTFGVVQAKELSKEDENVTNNEAAASKRKRLGFRERRIIAYEDRIRAYSTPDKIFRYFATLQTPDSGCLGLDSFERYDPAIEKPARLFELRPRDSVFRTLGNEALISFSDYIFLLTVLSTPPRQFEIAFRMFDSNADGNLDIDDFMHVQTILRDQTNVGKRHRDHSVTGSTLKPELNSALACYFFGQSGHGLLSIARMLDFQARLQRELNRIEFDRYRPDQRDCITELSFARLLIAYAGFPDIKKRRMLRRVREAFGSGGARGISFKQYAEFSRLLKSIADVDTALTFHHISGASIDKATFRHMAVTVASIELDSHLLDVVFVLFDEDGDGYLSNKEFVSVMKHRLSRGLDKSMDTGAIRMLSALSSCAQEQLFDWIRGGNR
uniref:Mitochondrial aspartate/glutamate carrier protein n=2 Tax=Macrostomum lignano TaxID=282301 RepID=A0A1I8G3C0_9PLAT